MIRLSVGAEHAADIFADLEQALDTLAPRVTVRAAYQMA